MTMRSSITTFNGVTVERYKNPITDLAHRPKLLLQWGRWVCVSYNARGEGTYGDLSIRGARDAYDEWNTAKNRFDYHQARRWAGRRIIF